MNYNEQSRVRLGGPDVVLLGVTMPRWDEVQATSQLRQELPETGVIIFSRHHRSVTGGYAVEWGAAGFIPKSDLARGLIRRVNEGRSEDQSGWDPRKNEDLPER